MRHNDARKWLHAALDLLPVLLIPVFMIYSHRHDVTQDFEVVEQVPVYYETNEVNSYTDLLVDNIYHWDDNLSSLEISSNYFLFTIKPTENLTFVSNLDDATELLCYLNDFGFNLRVTYSNGTYSYPSLNNITFDFVIDVIQNRITYADLIISHISSSQMLLVKEYQEVVTTIPQDVMTSFMDRFNNAIDKYFNMGNVFNLTGVYQWFNTNIFGGNAPTIIYSVWNIALYELVMDLLFLLYGLFMWFIDICKHLMEKPFKSIK